MIETTFRMARDLQVSLKERRHEHEARLEQDIVWAIVRMHAGTYASQHAYRSWPNMDQVARKTEAIPLRTPEEQKKYDSAKSIADLKKKLATVPGRAERYKAANKQGKKLKKKWVDKEYAIFPPGNHAELQFLREWPLLRDKLEARANDVEKTRLGRDPDPRIVVNRVDIFLNKSPCVLANEKKTAHCSRPEKVVDVRDGITLDFPAGCVNKFQILAPAYPHVEWNVLFDDWHNERRVATTSAEMAYISRVSSNISFYWMGKDMQNGLAAFTQTRKITRRLDLSEVESLRTRRDSE